MMLRTWSVVVRLVFFTGLVLSMLFSVHAPGVEQSLSETAQETTVYKSETRVVLRSKTVMLFKRIASTAFGLVLILPSLMALYRPLAPRLPIYPLFANQMKRLLLLPVKRTSLYPSL